MRKDYWNLSEVVGLFLAASPAHSTAAKRFGDLLPAKFEQAFGDRCEIFTE
jgi:hypothetical protein